MKLLFFILLLVAVYSTNGAELKLSGILGQSQPEKADVLRKRGVQSAVNDINGNILFSNGNNIYLLKNGSRVATVALKNSGGKLISDNKDIFLFRQTIIYRLNYQEDGTIKRSRIIDLRHGYPYVGVCDASTVDRFGKNVKFFAYNAKDKKVYGWDKKGNSLDVILDLSTFKSKGRILDVAIIPESGYMAVSTEYPDMRIYRFNTEGQVENGGIWPQGGPKESVAHFSLNDGKLWGSNNLSMLIENEQSGAKKVIIGDGSDKYAYAVCNDGENGYFVCSTQGLKHYNMSALKKCDYRLGGIGTLAALALADGKVIGVKGYNLIGLNLDDVPDAPLLNSGDESWHVGKNWSSDGVAIISEGKRFLILDRKHNKIWRFDPSVTRWPAKERMVALDYTLKNPTDMAYAGKTLIIADSGKINVPCDINVPIIKVDSFNSDELVCAGNGFVALLNKGKTIWKKQLSVRDIAVIGNNIAVASDELILLNKEGKVVSRLPYKLGCLAVDGKWLIAGDSSRAAILRFKLK